MLRAATAVAVLVGHLDGRSISLKLFQGVVVPELGRVFLEPLRYSRFEAIEHQSDQDRIVVVLFVVIGELVSESVEVVEHRRHRSQLLDAVDCGDDFKTVSQRPVTSPKMITGGLVVGLVDVGKGLLEILCRGAPELLAQEQHPQLGVFVLDRPIEGTEESIYILGLETRECGFALEPVQSLVDGGGVELAVGDEDGMAPIGVGAGRFRRRRGPSQSY